MGRIKYLEAIGQTPKRGRPPVGQSPSKAVLAKLYVRECRSVREVAATLGCTKDAVHRALKANGIDTRSRARRSKLRTISLQDIRAAIRNKGIRGTARDMGIDEGTIRHHLKVRNGK